MKLIEQNPFRILGITVNASAKDLAANIGKKRLLDIGREVTFPLDFPTLFGSIPRTSSMMDDANTAINLPQDKIKNALFWFAQPSDPIGKLAYDHLLQGNIEKASELFGRSTSWEAKLCLSTLNLHSSNYIEALTAIDDVIGLHCKEFCTSVAGQTFQSDYETLLQIYLEMLTSEVNADALYNAVSQGNVSKNIVDTLMRLAVDVPMSDIDRAIATAKSVDDDDAQAQLAAGKKLIADTKRPLSQLKQMAGNSDVRVSRLCDKLAGQIFQCSVNYHNAIDNSTDEPVNRTVLDECLKLANYAQSIAIGKMTHDRIQNGIDTLEEKKSKLPPAGLEKQDAAIKAKILELVLINGRTIDNAIKMMKECAPHIVAIKEQSSLHKSYYLDISTQIVSAALSSVIEEYNEVTNKIGNQLQNTYTRASALNSLKDVLKRAWKATLMMDKFDINDDFKKERYATNRKTLAEMYDNVFGSYSSSSSSISNNDLDLRTEDEYYNGCHTSSDYLAFMGRYPQSKHIEAAQDKYNRLRAEEERKRKEREEKERIERQNREADDRAFKSCISSSDFELYLRNYPHGLHSLEAKQKIKEKKETITNILPVVLVELIWLIIGIAADDYNTNWWAVFLGGGIGGWFAYVNFLAYGIFKWIISKLIDYEE